MMKSLRLKTKWIFFLGSMMALTVMAAAGEIIFESSGISSFKYERDVNNMRVATTTTQDYESFQVSVGEEDFAVYLVESKLTRQMNLDAEGVTGNLAWQVRGGDRLQDVLWSKSEDVTVVNYDHEYNLVVTGLEGCCAAMTGYRAYDLITGNLLLSFNNLSNKENVTTPYILEIPNSKLAPRFIGVITQDSTRDRDFAPPTKSDYAATALIKYNSRDGGYQRLQIDMKTAQGYAVSVMDIHLEKDPSVGKSNKIEIYGDKATLWNIDGATSKDQIEGVILSLTLNGGNGDKTLKIPVVQDRLNISKAQIPPDLIVY